MRLPVVLAAKISAVFLIVMMTFVVLTLSLFAEMVMHRSGDMRIAHDAHNRFMVVVLLLMAVSMVIMVGFVVLVTAPLRRMSESMDRIATGDLEHRVPIRGRDEGRAWGAASMRWRIVCGRWSLARRS